MRKGDKVYINATSRPATKPNSWTEKNEFGNEVLKAGTMLFHVSEYEKIESFYPCYTAFSIQEPVLTGFCYMFKLKKDIEFEHIDKYEYRINLVEHENDFDIVYLGKIDYNNKKVIVNKNGWIIRMFHKYSFAKEYKDIQKQLEKLEQKEIQKNFLDSYHTTCPAYLYKFKQG